MSDLAELTASELLARYADGSASPVEAVQACIDRIAAVDGSLNAVLLLLADQALEQAAASGRRWRAGTARPLEGVPYGLKDIIATAGVTTTGGSSLYREHVPTQDAALATRLAESGGILLAKLHTFEFACGGADNRTFGPCRNPWDLERTTGGSSSGSGAAVAAREVPLAIGTDTGGSIRIPAAYCGITALKPTFGRVPRHGVMGLSWSLDHAGPMTRSAEDAARMLAVIAGHHPGDPTSATRPVPDYVAGLDAPVAGMRLGRARAWYEDRMHPAVARAYEAALAELADLGLEIVDVSLPDIDVVESAAWTVIYAEMLSLHKDAAHLIEERDSMGAGMLAAGPYVYAADYLTALRYRSTFQRQLDEAMAGIDALVLPGSTTLPPRLTDMLADTAAGEVDWLEVACRPHVSFNYSGSPGLCLPSGFAGGMPASIQLVGRPHAEATLLTIGTAYQRATDHHRAAPSPALSIPAGPSTVDDPLIERSPA